VIRGRPVRAALLAVLLVSAALLGGELGRGALTAGEVPPPHPCKEHSSLSGSSYDAKLQRIVLDGLSRAACRLDTTRVQLVFALQSPADRQRIGRGRSLDKVLRQSMLQAVDEQRRSGSLGFVDAVVARQAIEHAPVSLVERALGISS
jgi:hypothetical protein